MKKITIFIFMLVCYGLFAQDARVMPAGTGRFNIMPSFSFATGERDAGGNFERFGSVQERLFNLGFGADLGVLDWLTVSAHWFPGWVARSDENTVTNNVSELFVGAKIQLLGEKAPFTSGEFRFAVNPGVYVPLITDQAFAFVTRFYFDWIFNRNFFVSLTNETMIFPGNQDFADAGPDFAHIRGNANYSLRFGLGSTFTAPITEGIDLTVGLPASYRYLPYPQHSLGVNPHVSFFFRNTALPLELKLQYYFPLWGRDTRARHDASLLFRIYFPPPPSEYEEENG